MRIWRRNHNKQRGSHPYYIAALLAMLALFLTGCEDMADADLSAAAQPKVQVIAHRAGAALAPENTLAALERAIQVGADIAEIDVQTTQDGVLVAMHDDSLERTTGLCCCVWETNWANVQQADAGSWYSLRYAGEQIPTLETLLSATKGKIPLMIEIKCTGHEQGTVEKVVEQIQAAGMEDSCTLGCADIRQLQQSKALAPTLETVYIGAVTDPALFALDYVDRFSLPMDTLTPETVALAKAQGKPIYTWTPDTQEELQAALAYGVDGVVTDDPPLAHTLLQ